MPRDIHHGNADNLDPIRSIQSPSRPSELEPRPTHPYAGRISGQDDGAASMTTPDRLRPIASTGNVGSSETGGSITAPSLREIFVTQLSMNQDAVLNAEDPLDYPQIAL